MIRISIYDGSLETPFRDICETTISSTSSKAKIIKEFWKLLKLHSRLRKGESELQRVYHDER